MAAIRLAPNFNLIQVYADLSKLTMADMNANLQLPVFPCDTGSDCLHARPQVCDEPVQVRGHPLHLPGLRLN